MWVSKKAWNKMQNSLDIATWKISRQEHEMKDLESKLDAVRRHLGLKWNPVFPSIKYEAEKS